MRAEQRKRWVEWGKNLLILLLSLSAVALLSRTLISDRVSDRMRNLLDGGSAAGAAGESAQTAFAAVRPARLAVTRDSQRCGVQYDQEQADAVFAGISTLLSEALGSAGDPEPIAEEVWRDALSRTGIYLDFLYPVPLAALAAWLGDENEALTGAARRFCLAEDGEGGVRLTYINEADGSYYACKTTLSSSLHLDAAVADSSPNGAMFAFEVEGMEDLAPYTLITATPEPALYAAANPLTGESGGVAELLSALSFRATSSLDPATGGAVAEGNDSLRLTAGGKVSFHTIGSAGFRFPLSENNLKGALERTQAIAEATAGAWCGAARLCLETAEETANGYELTFQYCLNGAPVLLPEGESAARFVVQEGAVTDFTLFLRAYTDTGETSLVLPGELAAAMGGEGRELTLLYQDTGGNLVKADWFAVTP